MQPIEPTLEKARNASRQIVEQIRICGYEVLANKLRRCNQCEIACPGIASCPYDRESAPSARTGVFSQYPSSSCTTLTV